jgi:glycosyltransferase involved in cell wall biosynthesis
MPFFSVVIPVYNGAATLSAAIDSVLAQRFKDFELIVINDGSNDDTLSILKQYKEVLGEQMDFRNQRNKGLGNARNRGIQIATGNYVALLDADDTWEPKKLQELHHYLVKKPNTEALFHQVYTSTAGKIRKRKAYLPSSKEELLTKGNPITPSAFAMKTDLFKSFNFSEKPEFHGAEDLHLWIRLFTAQTAFAYLPKPLATYYTDIGMSNRLGEHLRHVENVLEYFYKGDDISKATYRKALQRKRYEVARYCHKRGLFTKAEDYYIASQLNSPKVWLLRLLNFFGLAV